MRDEIIRLEDEPYTVISVYVPIGIGEISGGFAAHYKIAARIMIETAYYVQQRGFAAAARAENRYEFIGSELHGHAFESVYGGIRNFIVLFYVD